MTIVDDLLANPGLYIGIDTVADSDLRGAARTHDGGTIMVIGHEHAASVAVLRERDTGVFELGSESSPFPVKVAVSMPEPGRLRHSWWYGAPGGEAVERDVSVLERIT